LTDNQLSQLIRANYSTANKSTWFSLSFAPIPSYAFTYSDICFYKAEAALLGWGATPANAQTFFTEGQSCAGTSAIQYDGNPSAYEPVLNLSGLTDEQKMEKIATQKWIHLFGRDMEAFAEWRRTGYLD
jgi:hypothetical protein